MTNANQFFGSSTGSENFYQNSDSSIIYTDGVRDMAEACDAYWLIDLITSHQQSKLVKMASFQVWMLYRTAKHVFRIVAKDGNDLRIATQRPFFSDFRYDTVTLWLVNGCLMMPNEY